MKTIITSIITAMTLALSLPTMANEDVNTDNAEAVILYVDINNDSAEKIADLLKGVGIKKAEAIVSHREEFGPFTAAEDLMQVSGIGPATLEKNRAAILIGETEY